MNNPQFHRLLRRQTDEYGQPFTVGKLAKKLCAGRSRVNDALNNLPGRGGQLRPKLARYFKEHFPLASDRLLAALGWDENGNPVPRGESHVEQTKTPPATLPLESGGEGAG